MVGVKWLCRCDVFLSQVASISVHNHEGRGGFPHTGRPRRGGKEKGFTGQNTHLMKHKENKHLAYVFLECCLNYFYVCSVNIQHEQQAT